MDRDRRLLFGLIPAAVAIAAYANSVPGDFVFDDTVLIERSQSLHAFDLDRIFLQNYWGSERADRNYRPLTLLTYAANLQLGPSAWHFHAVNVALNAIAAFLAWLLLDEVLRKGAGGSGPEPAGAAATGGIPEGAISTGAIAAEATATSTIAALGATLYAVLPIRTEAVSNIVGRAEILAGIAILGALLAALKAVPTDRRARFEACRGSPSGRGMASQDRDAQERWSLALIAAGTTFLGLLSKENAVVVPILIVISAAILRRRIPWKAVAGSAVAVILYIAARTVVLLEKEEVSSLIDNPLAFAGGPTRALNAVMLLGLYVAKTVFPAHLSADYSYNQIPVLPLSDPLLWLSAAVVIAFAALGLAIAWRRLPVLALAVAFLLVTAGLTSNILFPIGTIFGERLFYTPSLALPMAACAILAAAPLRSGSTAIVSRGILCVIIALYGARTWTRNQDWAAAETMYARMPLDAPGSSRSHTKAAEGLLEQWLKLPSTAGQGALLERAKAALREAIRIYPEHGHAHAVLGRILLLEGKHVEAEGELRTGEALMVKLHQVQHPVYLYIAEVSLHLGRHAEALSAAERYLAIAHPPDGIGYNFRGLALALQGRYGEALADFSRALSLRQDQPEIWNNRAMCRTHLGDLSGALEDWKKALELSRAKPRQAGEVPALLQKMAAAHVELAKAHRAAGREEAARAAEAEAERCLSEARAVRR